MFFVFIFGTVNINHIPILNKMIAVVVHVIKVTVHFIVSLF